MKRDELISALNEYLQIELFNDYGPNGLQVEGQKEINKIITGVSASIELIKEAIREKAEAILVHHGILWNGQNPVIRGAFRERLKLLLENEINLLAYHLPLDAHPEVGNNAQMAKFLELEKVEPFGKYKGQMLGICGELKKEMPIEIFLQKVETICQREPLHLNFGKSAIRTVAIISGGAQKYLDEAIEKGVDCFITGEVSEYNYYQAMEERIHFISAGHHATERFGIQALGRWIVSRFGLEVQYNDSNNPI
jgi:dinuclear metal center YbgI/SA1388 family protein